MKEEEEEKEEDWVGEEEGKFFDFNVPSTEDERGGRGGKKGGRGREEGKAVGRLRGRGAREEVL